MIHLPLVFPICRRFPGWDEKPTQSVVHRSLLQIISVNTETFPLLAFSCTPFNWALVLILQQKGWLAYEVMLFSPSWKCYLNLDILIKSYIDLNIMTEKRYLCSLQQSDTSQHFGLQKIKLVLYDCVTVNPKKRLDFVVWCHKERHANQFSHAQSVLQLH